MKILFVSDTLLCHDDELEGRRVAFIFYLVPPWHKEDGGMSITIFRGSERGKLGIGVFSSTGKMRLDFLGLGVANEKINRDRDF